MAGHTAEEGEAAAQREEEEAKKQYTRTLSKVKLLPSFVAAREITFFCLQLTIRL